MMTRGLIMCVMGFLFMGEVYFLKCDDRNELNKEGSSG